MKRKILIITASIIIICTVLVATSALVVFIYYRKNVNTEYDEFLFKQEKGVSSTVVYANSSPSNNEYIPVRLDIGGQTKKIYYSLDEISNYLIDGFISVEDRNFYQHSGVDIRRTVYATVNYLSGKGKFGASTITQQLIKNISGDNEVSIQRKATEIIRAYNVEKKHSKNEIMEVYLNVIPMGNEIYGVGAASEIYFGKSPKDLNVVEAATLIGITNAPSAYDPYKNPEKCLEKRNRILQVMFSQGIIDNDELLLSLDSPLSINGKSYENADSWYVETVIYDVVRDYAEKMNVSESMARLVILSGGFSIYTPIDLRVQNILDNVFTDLDYLPAETKDGFNYSMIVINPQNGDILGIIGGAGKKTQNRILNQAQVPHPPASTLKPIALYAPLIDENVINWSTVFDDTPIRFIEKDGEFYEYPHNSPDRYDGLMTVKDAIKYSKNTVAIRAFNMRGAENVFNTLKYDYGFDTLVESRKNASGSILTDKAEAPLALGQLTDGVSIRKLTESYTAFPNYGKKMQSRTYLYVTDKDGEVVLNKDVKYNMVFSEETGKIMNQLLSEVVKGGTAKSITLNEITEVAGKTGTSTKNRDKIFVGYTPSLVAGIWCGYNDNRSINATSPSHLQIWDKVMKEIYEVCYSGRSEKFITDGLIFAPYCMDSGKSFSHNCVYDPRGSRLEYGYFKADDIKYKDSCDTHIIVNYDSENKGVVINPLEDKEYSKVSLVKNQSRSFPKEVYITDAEYVYRDVNLRYEVYFGENVPYFYSTLKDGEYVGISNKKKQFNRLSP